MAAIETVRRKPWGFVFLALALVGGALGMYGRSAFEEMRRPNVSAPSPLTPELLDEVDARIRAQRDS